MATFCRAAFCKRLWALAMLLVWLVPVMAGVIKQGNAPAWIKQVKPDIAAAVPIYEAEYGLYCLLYDYQINEASGERYLHLAQKVVNGPGVEAASQLKFIYDKSFENLVVHYVDVIRDGKTIHKLDFSKMKTIQEAKDMDMLQYDERMTGLYFIEDVRPGDIIEYAYTLSGNNPLFDKKCTENFEFRFAIPIRNLFYRMLIPESRKIQIKYFNDAEKATENHDNGNYEISWDVHNIKVLKPDDDLPSGFYPAPYAMVSEYNNWQEVKDWGSQLYKPVMVSGVLVKRKAAEIAAIYASDTDRVIGALRYVQDQIRYLGIETGLNTHKPHLPEQVIKQGYGDCKDKALLLCCLLKEMHITAYPVLIRTNAADEMPDYLPSPLRFNHVCVAVSYGGNYHYFDPTISLQRGTFSNTYFPFYKYGLVIMDSTNTLLKLPFNPATSRLMLERFTLGDTISPAQFTVTTTLTGADADFFREKVASTSLQQIQKSHFNYFASIFKEISPDGALGVEQDDSVADKIIVYESYTIPNFWKYNEDKRRWMVKFAAEDINSELNKPKNRNRSMPVGINYPCNVTEIMEISYTFKDQNSEDSIIRINDAVKFTFHSKYQKSKQLLTLKYTLVTHASMVPVAEVKKYYKDLDAITSSLGYNIYLPLAGSAARKFSVSFAMLFMFLTAAGITAFVCLRAYKLFDVTTVYIGQQPLPLGGWLMLLTFSIALRLLKAVVHFATSSIFNSFYDEALFGKTSNGYNLALARIVAFEDFFLGYRFVMLIFLAVLLQKKRSIFFSVFTVLALSVICFYCVDLGLAYFIGAGEKTIRTAWMSLFSSTLYAVVWVPYLFMSDRAKKTFTRWHPSRQLSLLQAEEPQQINVVDGHERFMPPGE